jgi:hypothetical protein
MKMELKKNSCEEKLQITQVSYCFSLKGNCKHSQFLGDFL